MKRNAAIRLLSAMVFGLVLLVWLTGSAAGARQPSYQRDAVGDSARAADIVSTTLSDANGIVTLTVQVAGHRFDQATDGEFAFHTMVDIDRNTATGAPSGADYDLLALHNAHGVSACVWHFADFGWRELKLQPSMTLTTTSDTYTFTFATGELGGGSGFDYYVSSFAWSSSEPLGTDRAPDAGTWSYWPLTTQTWNGGGAVAALTNGTLYLSGDDSAWHLIDHATLVALGLDGSPVTVYDVLPGAIGDPVARIAVVTPLPTPTPVTPAAAPIVKPVIAIPVTYPAKPLAGKTFSLTFAVTRSDTGGKLLEGKMICDPSVKGTVIKHFELFKHGTATMRFTIPKAYKGKLMKVHLTIEALGQSATRNIMFRVD